MKRDRKAVGEEHDKNDSNEEGVQHESGEDLDDGEHADAEIDLLEEEAVFQDRVGAAVETFAEEKPGDYAAEHPEHEWDITGRSGFEAHLENDPEDKHIDGGMNEGPENTEIGAEVLAAEVLFCQLQDHVAAQEQVFEEE